MYPYAHPNSMNYWYPRLVRSGVPTPDTLMVSAPCVIWDTEKPEPEKLEMFAKQIDHAAMLLGGYPVFLRAGGTSNKHEWKDTCHLHPQGDEKERITTITRQAINIAYFGACCGGPDLDLQTFAVRRMIPTTPIYTAFDGNLPVTREFRLFIEFDEVKDDSEPTPTGKFIRMPESVPRVEHFQAYWPEEALEKYAHAIEWREKLATMNTVTSEEIEELSAIALKAAEPFKIMAEAWSIDLLQDAYGKWWVTDMALAATSYRHEARPEWLATQMQAA